MRIIKIRYAANQINDGCRIYKKSCGILICKSLVYKTRSNTSIKWKDYVNKLINLLKKSVGGGNGRKSKVLTNERMRLINLSTNKFNLFRSSKSSELWFLFQLFWIKYCHLCFCYQNNSFRSNSSLVSTMECRLNTN